MLLGQFYNINIYVKIVEKIKDQHFNVSLSSNPENKIKKNENCGTNLSPIFNKNRDLFPWIGKEQYIEILFWHCSNNPDICVYVGKLPNNILM